jgi:hypothetical protein
MRCSKSPRGNGAGQPGRRLTCRLEHVRRLFEAPSSSSLLKIRARCRIGGNVTHSHFVKSTRKLACNRRRVRCVQGADHQQIPLSPRRSHNYSLNFCSSIKELRLTRQRCPDSSTRCAPICPPPDTLLVLIMVNRAGGRDTCLTYDRNRDALAWTVDRPVHFAVS